MSQLINQDKIKEACEDTLKTLWHRSIIYAFSWVMEQSLDEIYRAIPFECFS